MKARGACLVAILLVAVACLAAEGAGGLTISKPEAFGRAARPPVAFPHEDHWAFEGATCLDCHHDWKGGENVVDLGALMAGGPEMRCSSCHDRAARLQAAFHLQCIGCHDRVARRREPTGPRACGECHPWSR